MEDAQRVGSRSQRLTAASLQVRDQGRRGSRSLRPRQKRPVARALQASTVGPALFQTPTPSAPLRANIARWAMAAVAVQAGARAPPLVCGTFASARLLGPHARLPS